MCVVKFCQPPPFYFWSFVTENQYVHGWATFRVQDFCSLPPNDMSRNTYHIFGTTGNIIFLEGKATAE